LEVNYGQINIIKEHAISMVLYNFRSDEVQFDESNKLRYAEVYPKDELDASMSESLSARWSKCAKAISNYWTLDFEKFALVIKGYIYYLL
jgi:hypothetical protein